MEKRHLALFSTQKIAHALLLETNHHPASCNRSGFCGLPVTSLTILERPRLKGQDLRKLVIFTVSSRKFLTETIFKKIESV